MPSFYEKANGAVISASINKFIYITVNKKFGDNIRISYSKTETIDCVDQIQHPIFKECLKKCQINNSIEISSLADIPAKGTGLGSSSAFTVGLLKALYNYKGIYKTNDTLAEEACDIELNKCNEPIGKQDQYGTAIGGFKELSFFKDGTVQINKLSLQKNRLKNLNENLLIVFTGKTRSASEILARQSQVLVNDINKKKIMQEMVNLVKDFKYELIKGDIDNLGEILHENWIRKASITDSISTPWINEAYAIAMDNGAKGGKILGAGNGGFFLFFAHPKYHDKIISKLPKMSKFDFLFEPNGCQLVYSDQ